MKSRTKIWLIIAASLFLLGGTLFTVAMTTMNWDFSKLSISNYETNTHEITKTYQNISITTDTANIRILPSADGKTQVVCHELDNANHTVTVENGTLTIRLNDTRPWYERIVIGFGSPTVTVYLPDRAYGDVAIHAVTGDVQLSDLQLESLSIQAVTGDVSLENVIAAQHFTFLLTTGDVRFDGCDAAEISIRLTSGDVTGSLLTEKSFEIKQTTGHVDVPSTTGGSCQITVTTGDIQLTVQ